MPTQVAVVTGSNKGYAIVRALCKRIPGAHIYLTARQEPLGKAAVQQLQAEGLQAYFHRLDITDSSSIARLATFLGEQYGGVDILVNNAAILFPASTEASFAKQAEITCRTNYRGTLEMCEKFLPLMRQHARIVNVSSRGGHGGQIVDDKLRERLLSDTLTVKELTGIMDRFVQCAKSEDMDESVFKKSPYCVSKVGVIVMTRLLQRSNAARDVLVNCYCPGLIATDMSMNSGYLKERPPPGTADDGADTAVYLALLPPDDAENPRGEFFHKRTVIDWRTFREC